MIHPTAIIDKNAILGKNISVGAYAIIEGEVTIGDNTTVGHHAHIKGPTTLGKNNTIYPFAFIGTDPQDKKYAGEVTTLKAGDNNTFREFVTISRGTAQDQSLTLIGNDNLFMSYCHVAHDCHIGSYNTFSNNASLAGHVHVEDYVGFGGFSAVHQFSKVGAYAFCAGGSIITKDVPPFTLISGYPAKLSGLNSEGLKRRGFSNEARDQIKQAYKDLFRSTGVIRQVAEELLKNSESNDVKALAQFILRSSRGVVR